MPLEDLFAILPVGYQAQAFRWLVLSTVAVWIFRRGVIPILVWGSDITAAKWDNVFVLRLSNTLDAAATWLDTALRIAPRMSLGPSPAKEPITTRISRRPPPLLMAPPPIGSPLPVGERATLPELAAASFDEPGEVTKAESIRAKASQRPQEPGSTPGGTTGTP